ncbi:uncharacterized protein LOC144866402 [Branchiostoma floridae x Branchiostoma japonicum]
MSGRKRISKRELLSLLGKLNWAARVVRGGRTFMRRLIDLSKTLRRPHHYARLSGEARADLDWWTNFMAKFNGTAVFLDRNPVPPTIFNTDACDSGGAAFYSGDWFYVSWRHDDPDMCDRHINEKELYTIILAARRWGSLWSGKRVIVFADSDSSVCAINKGTSPSPPFMRCIRELFWISAENNFSLQARHVKGKENTLADALSRLNDSVHAELARSRVEQWKLENADISVDCHQPHLSHHARSALPTQATSWIPTLQ